MFNDKGQLTFNLSAIFSLVFLMFPGNQAGAQATDPDIFNQLEYRHIGPPGNRVSAVAGVPGDPTVYYAGNPAGGIHKSTDGGIAWFPIFDDQEVPFIGAVAVAPSDSNIVWAGTGETWFRNNNKYLPIGNGVYKSTDAGETWTHAGLDKTGRIGRIVIHPQNPDIVFVAAMGHSYGPQEERGVFRTRDGGETWERVLFVDPDTGSSDIAMDPNNPDILFAGMWQTWGERSGGPGSGLHVSRDGGDTWEELTGNGLPEPPVGKVGIAIAPSDSNRIYVLIETGGGMPFQGQETSSGALWASNDGGENWELRSYDLNMAGRTHYYTRAAVSPDNPDEIFFLSAPLSVSTDGGESITRIGQGLHGDHHDIWIDPTNGDRMIDSNDGGVGISLNRGRTWEQINIANAQMYHVTVDNQIPYNVYGNLQDGPSHRGPSNSRYTVRGGGGIARGAWHAVGGSEAGIAVADPVDNNIIWSTGHPAGAVDIYDLRTGHKREVGVWPDNVWGWADIDLKYRFYRTFPLIISPHDHNRVYIGSQFVHMTTDGGHSWEIISPDLSTGDESRLQSMVSLTPMNSGTEDGVVFALAESPLREGVIWAGTNDGLVQVTLDGGANWSNVTTNIPDLPPWGTVSHIEASRYDPGTAYIAVNLHEENIRNPFVYKTSDYGESWESLSSTLPTSDTFSINTRVIEEDPVREGLLYLGTDYALFVSFDDGANWLPLHTNFPYTPVHGVVVQEHFNDLVVGTHGRGFWILDDITPLQQLTPEVLESDVHLFDLRPAYRFQPIEPPVAQRGDPSVGDNPPYGASINYYLQAEGAAEVTIGIVDDEGQTIRILDGSADRGINRVWWDLRYNLTDEPRLRTSPLIAPWVELGPDGWRPIPGGAAGRTAIMAPPGNYTVTLSVDGEESSANLVVVKDPHTVGTEEDIQAQTALLLEVRDLINSVAGMINQSETIRSQIYALQDTLGDDDSAQSIVVAAGQLDQEIISVSENLYEMKSTGRGQDNTFREPAKLLTRLLGMVGNVSSADFPPTTQLYEVHEEFENLTEGYLNQFNELLEEDLPAFNNLLEESNIPPISLSDQ